MPPCAAFGRLPVLHPVPARFPLTTKTSHDESCASLLTLHRPRDLPQFVGSPHWIEASHGGLARRRRHLPPAKTTTGPPPLRTTTTTSSRCRNTTKPRPTLPPRTNGAKIAPPGLRRHLQLQLLTFPAPVQPSLRARLSQPWPRGSPEAWRWSVAMPKGGRPAL